MLRSDHRWYVAVQHVASDLDAARMKSVAVGAGVTDEVLHGLSQIGLDVLFDDRGERAGVKFKGAHLIGVPLRTGMGRRGLTGGSLVSTIV